MLIASLASGKNEMDGGDTISSQLVKRTEEIRRKLHSLETETIAKRSGARLEENALHLQLLGEEYLVKLPDYEVQSLSNDSSEYVNVLILDYLRRAEDVDSNRWIAFREIPHGEFYSDNFKRTTETKLTRKFQGRKDQFVEVANKCGGSSISLGDVGFSFDVLPRFNIALVFWDGGEEFRDQVNLLFEESAPRCLPTEGLAMVGRELCSQFIEKAQSDQL
ncbi:MAG: DUF3786 domain-containing protein [Candidatus Bipolaricaulota bacterium]